MKAEACITLRETQGRGGVDVCEAERRRRVDCRGLPTAAPYFFLEEAPTVRHEGGQRESKRRIETGVN